MANIGLHIHIEGLNEINRNMKKLGADFSKRKYLNSIGIMLLGWSNDQFATEGKAKGRLLKWRKLRPSTVAGRRGGSKKILQDTGRLRMSFVYKVHHSNEWVELGSADKRAPWHHFGTSGPYVIRSKGKKMLRFMTPGGPRFARRVVHPGLPARPLIPSQSNGTRMAMEVLDAYVKRALKKLEA